MSLWSCPTGRRLSTASPSRRGHRGGVRPLRRDPLFTGSHWSGRHAALGRRDRDAAPDRFAILVPELFTATGNLIDAARSGWGRWSTAREYRAFTNVPRTEGGFWEPAIDPSGRLLVVPDARGLGFWEPTGGAKLGVFPLGRHCFFDGSGDLWTNSDGGVLHWPVRWGMDGAVHLGPPDWLATTNTFNQHQGVSNSRDGRVVAVAIFEGAVVLHRDQPGRAIWLGPQADCRDVAVSPDGRYVLTATHHSPASTIWDARSGRPLKAFDGEGQVGFTGDGLRLLAGGRLWTLGSWQPGPAVGGGEFAEGAGLLASGTGPIVSLISVATGHEVARLENPNQDVVKFRSFSPDGTRLFTTSQLSASISAWDLRLIRRRLAELDLDWDAPPFPPEAPRPDPPPRRLAIDFGSMEPLLDDPQQLLTRYGTALTSRPRNAEKLHRRALVRGRLERWDEALADARAAAELAPRERRAWFLVGRIQLALRRLDEAVASLRRAIDCPTGPGDHPVELAEASLLEEATWRCVIDPARLREPGRVLPLISAAIEILPLPSYRSTLGVVYYRLGRHRDAIACFEQGLDQQRWADQAVANLSPYGRWYFRSFDQQRRADQTLALYFLAMSYHRAGEPAKARAALDRAVELQDRIELGPPALARFNAFRAEAERTLAN